MAFGRGVVALALLAGVVSGCITARPMGSPSDSHVGTTPSERETGLLDRAVFGESANFSNLSKNVSGDDWTAVTYDVPPGATGTVTLSVEGNYLAANESEGKLSLLFAMSELDGLPISMIFGGLLGSEHVVVELGAAGTHVSRVLPGEGTGAPVSIGLEAKVADYAKFSGNPGVLHRVTLIAGVLGGVGVRESFENPRGLAAHAKSGPDPIALGVRAFDRAEFASASVRAPRSSFVGGEVEFARAATRTVTSPSGLSGWMTPPITPVGATQMRVQNDAGYSEETTVLVVDGLPVPAQGQLPFLQFGSRAAKWDFEIATTANVGLWSGPIVLAVPACPGCPEGAKS